ncbi:hypothetical protein NUW87_11605, partial [Corynebacterium pilbarense]
LSLQHPRVFGCDAYVHVPKENRSKLDKKVEKCIFIGYKDGVKGYNLWNPETQKPRKLFPVEMSFSER